MASLQVQSRTAASQHGRRRSSLVLSLILLLQVLDVMCFATAFKGPAEHQEGLTPTSTTTSKPSRTSSTRLRGTLSWSGDATASIDLSSDDDENSNTVPEKGLSIRDWLDDPSASNIPLLGTDDVEKNSDGNFLCRQPPIDFLGVVLQPVFLNKISRTKPGCATVSILDAKTKVTGNNGGRTSNIAGNAIQNLMQDSKFQGRSIIQANDERLTVDLNLTLKVTLPPFLLIPPGFNSMGSSIMKRAGKARSNQLLRDLQRDYQAWVATKTGATATTTTSQNKKSKNQQTTQKR